MDAAFDPKAYLQQLPWMDHDINALLEQRQQYMDMATHITGTLDSIRVSGSGPDSKLEQCVIKLVDLERDIDAEIDAFVDLTRLIKRIIAQIPDKRHRDILTWRYINRWDWQRIADAMAYDRIWVWRLHGDALQEFQKIFEKMPEFQKLATKSNIEV